MIDASTVDNTVTLSGGDLSATTNLVVNGAFNWSGGRLFRARVIANDQLLITGAGDKSLDASELNNVRLASWRGGALQVDGNAVLNNLAGATFKLGDRLLLPQQFRDLQ